MRDEMHPDERPNRKAQAAEPERELPPKTKKSRFDYIKDQSGITKAAMHVLRMEERGLRLGSNAGNSETGGNADSEEDDSLKARHAFRLTAKYTERLSKRRAELPPTLPRPLPLRKKTGKPPRARARPSPVIHPGSPAPKANTHTQAVIPSAGLVSSSTATPSYTAPDTDGTAPTAVDNMAPQRPTAQSATEPEKTRSMPKPDASQPIQIAFIKENRQRLIQRLAVQFKNASGDGPGSSKQPDPERVSELTAFLIYLDERVQMTPQIQAATYIGQALELITDAKYGFPVEFVDRATALRAKWDALNWGAPGPSDKIGNNGDNGDDNENAETDEEEAMDTGSSRGGSSAPRLPRRETVDHLPASDHPIYGDKGIMAGVIITKSKISDDAKHARTVYRRHPFFPQKSAQVFGDNGLQVGSWWPLQIAALVHGAHGSSQGGISGSERVGGAYSIVVSGGNPQYHELDDDRGDTVYYSGSRSHANRDPKNFAEPVNHFTQALIASYKSRKPVRLLRSAPAGGNNAKRASLGPNAFPSRWAPCLGIRYDGLYTIVDMTAAVNESGGLYERFQLQRNPGQTPLEQVRKTSPTAKQRKDFLKISEGY